MMATRPHGDLIAGTTVVGKGPRGGCSKRAIGWRVATHNIIIAIAIPARSKERRVQATRRGRTSATLDERTRIRARFGIWGTVIVVVARTKRQRSESLLSRTLTARAAPIEHVEGRYPFAVSAIAPRQEARAFIGAVAIPSLDGVAIFCCGHDELAVVFFFGEPLGMMVTWFTMWYTKVPLFVLKDMEQWKNRWFEDFITFKKGLLKYVGFCFWVMRNQNVSTP
jgi:hypothetical protein